MDLTIRDNLLTEDISSQKEKAARLASEEVPVFVQNQPDIPSILSQAREFLAAENIILVGYGGSNTSFRAASKALYKGNKRIEIADTIEPDRINEIKERCSIDDSLVILISKSGTTANVLQAYFHFKDYRMVIITEANGQALHQISRRKGIRLIEHPPVGGRYSARTSCAYFPLAVLGIPIEEMEEGFREAYAKCGPHFGIEDNPALMLAAKCLLLEERGYNEIFMPLYSPYLEGFSELIVQLIHESTAKHGRGQTILPSLGPGSQHHTNQRYFGGRKDVIGLFVAVKDFHADSITKVEDDLRDIAYKDRNLSIFEGLPLSKALEFELFGTYQNSIDKNIPCAMIEMPSISARSIGELIGFLQYFTVYSAVLRDVNPFDQPAVEDSKRISIELIRRFAQR